MFFEHIVSKANDIVMVAEIGKSDDGFRIVYVNEAFSRHFGYSADEALGQSPRILQGPETCAATVGEISAAVHRGAAIRRRILNYDKGGRRIWIDVNIVPLASSEGRTTHFAAIERDVTADVLREGTLEDLALTDALTNAGNRRYFDQILERELSRSRRSHAPLALAVLDLDHFKSINDAWGHPAGDRVLVTFVKAVQEAVRNYDYVARIGGEEFAVVLPGSARSDALVVADRICASVRSTNFFVTEDHAIRVTCSAGLTSAATSDDNSESLMRRADHALYLAKSGGRDRVVAFEL
jgi:diguanylate cyclase (GGDEF)-like protein/PAS domain S-box-containing protein